MHNHLLYSQVRIKSGPRLCLLSSYALGNLSETKATKLSTLSVWVNNRRVFGRWSRPGSQVQDIHRDLHFTSPILFHFYRSFLCSAHSNLYSQQEPE